MTAASGGTAGAVGCEEQPVTGVVGIGPAVVIHEGSTLVVIASALRLLTFGRERAGAAGPRSSS